jgi:hypothetical protein
MGVKSPAGPGGKENRALDTWSEQLDEPSLEKLLEAQTQLVARLVSEGKDTAEANARLYELSTTLAAIRRKTQATSTAQ